MAGYSERMSRVWKKLKEMELPESMFDAHFAEKAAESKKLVEVLLERQWEREKKSGAYEGLDLPWTELRKQYEQDATKRKVEDYTATRAVVPHWKKWLDITAYVWKSEIQQLIERQERKKRKGT